MIRRHKDEIKGAIAAMNHTGNRKHRHFTSFQVIILGFFSVILSCSLLLMLPLSTRDGNGASFADSFLLPHRQFV